MSGDEIRRLREALGMNVAQFAQLMGVHATTAYRWETAKGTVTLDPLHASLLMRLNQTMENKPTKPERDKWAKTLMAGILLGGTLAGLAILLAELIPAGQAPAGSAARVVSDPRKSRKA